MKGVQCYLRCISKISFVLLFLYIFAFTCVYADVIFYEDFESGWNNWGADNGVWEVGVPTAGPDSAHGGTQCAATNLDGNYDPGTDSQLISPSILLSPVAENEEVHLRFWQWFSFYPNWDYGLVRVSAYNDGERIWSDWTDVSSGIEGTSKKWSMMDVDLTSYAGKKIRVAFFLSSWHDEDLGWYIDDVEVAVFDPTAPTSTTTTISGSTTTIPISTTTIPSTDITVDFTGSPTFGFTPLTVNFTNLSTGNISGYLWNFGDGSTSGEHSPDHVYASMGNFGVTLTAYGVDGSSKTEAKPNYVFVLLGCPFMSTLDNQDDIDTLRILRDSMLDNIFGLILTCIYYQNAAEVTSILSENPELQDKLRDLVSDNISVGVALINKGEASVSKGNVEGVIDFLNKLKAEGNPQLKADLNLAIEAIKAGYFLYGLGVELN